MFCVCTDTIFADKSILFVDHLIFNSSDNTTTAESEEGKGEDTAEEAAAVPTPVIQSPPAEEEAPAEAEAPKEEASCTVADLIEEEEEEEAKEDKEEEVSPAAAPEAEEETAEKTEEAEEKVESNGDTTEAVEDTESEDKMTEDEKKVDADEKRSQKSENKTAAELAYEWDDEGVEEEKPKKKESPKKKEGKSAAVLRAEAEVTPGRKSSRTPKPTQRKLESEGQKNLSIKDPADEDEEDEESVDAIAKELEKSDGTSPGKGKGSPKKGKKPVSEEKSKEEWVNLIFGENGEKVTDKGRKAGEEEKPKAAKAAGADGDDAEDYVPTDDTPKSKKGGRPKKKGLDDQFEEVEKLGSNMYFYTGPGGSRFPFSRRFYKILFTSYKFLLILLIFTSGSPPPYNDSDEEDLPIKKENAAPARKSGRANKGLLKYFEKGFRTFIEIKHRQVQLILMLL